MVEGARGIQPGGGVRRLSDEGEPLPELDTGAHEAADDLVSQLTEVAEALGVPVRNVPETEWSHGEAKGVCKPLEGSDADALVTVKDRTNTAALAGALIHEYAHAQLHPDVNDEAEWAKREVEAERAEREVGAEVVMYVIGAMMAA